MKAVRSEVDYQELSSDRSFSSDGSSIQPLRKYLGGNSRPPAPFSIRQALEEPQLGKYTASSPREELLAEAYTAKDFRRAWKSFLANSSLQQNIPLWNILSRLEWELVGDDKVLLYFSSRAAVGEFSSVRQQCLEHLWQSLRNHCIRVEPIVKADQTSKVIYTQEEKYHFLVEKNPFVAQLRARLGLDLYN